MSLSLDEESDDVGGRRGVRVSGQGIGCSRRCVKERLGIGNGVNRCLPIIATSGIAATPLHDIPGTAINVRVV